MKTRKMLCALLLSLAPAWALAAADVNRATQAELESVKGIGPAMSTRLLDERKKAPFKNWDDLIGRVKGLGPGNAARLSEAGLTVDGSSYAGAAAQPVRPAASRAARPARPASQ